MSLGSNIKKRLDELNLTVKELADRTHVAPTTIYSMIQRDSKKADVDLLISIAKELHTTTDALLGSQNDKINVSDEHQNFILQVSELTQHDSSPQLSLYLEMLRVLHQNQRKSKKMPPGLNPQKMPVYGAVVNGKLIATNNVSLEGPFPPKEKAALNGHVIGERKKKRA